MEEIQQHQLKELQNLYLKVTVNGAGGEQITAVKNKRGHTTKRKVILNF